MFVKAVDGQQGWDKGRISWTALLKSLTQPWGAADSAHYRLHFSSEASVVSILCQIKGLIYSCYNSTEFRQATWVRNLAFNFLHREYYFFPLILLQSTSKSPKMDLAPAKHVSTTHVGSMWGIIVRETGLLPHLSCLVGLFRLTSLVVLFSARQSAPLRIWLKRAEMMTDGKTPVAFPGSWIVPWLMACLDGSGEVWGRQDSESIPSITNISAVFILTRAFTRYKRCLLLSPAHRSSYLTMLVTPLQFSLCSATH